MNELVGSLFNAALTEGDKGLVDIGEVVLLMSQPTYSLDMSGQVIKSRRISDFRFTAQAKSLRNLAKVLNEYAQALEDLKKQASLAPIHEPGEHK